MGCMYQSFEKFPGRKPRTVPLAIAGFLNHQESTVVDGQENFPGWWLNMIEAVFCIISHQVMCLIMPFKQATNNHLPYRTGNKRTTGCHGFSHFFVDQKHIEDEFDPKRPPYSPVSLNSSAALQYWQRSIDFFVFPGVELFESIAHLLHLLVEVWHAKCKGKTRGTER